MSRAALILTFISMSAGLLFNSGCRETRSREDSLKLLTYSNVDKAHEITTGKDVVIAVLDWQFDLNGREGKKYIHPASMIQGEEAGDLKPWHGEWMAEIAHKVAPDAKIIPIRARSIETRIYEKYLIQGIYYAADHGAAAVSSSMGMLKNSEELKAAIDYAEEKGTLFIDVHPEYCIVDGKRKFDKPENIDSRIIHTGVVSVPDHVTKPKEYRDIYTWAYDLDAKYEDGWGYSNAPPVVLGTVALMKSVNRDLTTSEVREIIVSTTAVKDSFRVLDADAAVKEALRRKDKRSNRD